jgi:glycerol-3-phosphate acyltransferase PlsY
MIAPNNNLISVTLPILGFLCGSIPFGVFVGRCMGKDIQKHGSGNIGFANALRTLGWKPALLVLIGDILKGFIPALVSRHYFGLNEITIITSFSAVAGHIFCPWLAFKGGKGVATLVGVSLALCYPAALVTAAIWSGIFLMGRTASVASLALPPLMLILVHSMQPNLTLLYAAFFLLLLFTHRSNIKRLLAHSELKIT